MTKRISGSPSSKICSSLADPRIGIRRIHGPERIATMTVLLSYVVWKLGKILPSLE